MFRGEKINATEKWAVLHVTLRAPEGVSIVVYGKFDDADSVAQAAAAVIAREARDAVSACGFGSNTFPLNDLGTKRAFPNGGTPFALMIVDETSRLRYSFSIQNKKDKLPHLLSAFDSATATPQRGPSLGL